MGIHGGLEVEKYWNLQRYKFCIFLKGGGGGLQFTYFIIKFGSRRQRNDFRDKGRVKNVGVVSYYGLTRLQQDLLKN